MGLINKATLLKREELKTVQVDLGNEEYVFVREMTAHERDQFERSLMRQVRDMHGKTTGYEQSLEDFRAKLAVVTMCDENGDMILEPKDAATLSKSMSAVKLVKIVEAAQKLNRIGEEEREEIIKNSEVGQADNSSSDSAEKSV